MFGFICCCCRSRVVVQYVGTPNCPISAPDGNSYSSKPFVRTNPSLLAKVKEVMQVTAGHAAPAKVYKEVIRSQDSGCAGSTDVSPQPKTGLYSSIILPLISL